MTGAGFAVEFGASTADVDAALWDACFPAPLEGRWWYEALERSGLGDQFRFMYGVIRRDGVPVGIAPAFTMRFPVSLVAPEALAPALRWLGRVAPSLSHPLTLFVGSPCADEGTVGFVDGVDRRGALLAVQRAAEARAKDLGASLLVWKDFPDACAADLDWLAGEAGLFRVASFPGTVAGLPAGGRAAYLAALKGSRRRQLAKKLRRSRALVEFDIEVLQAPDAAVLDELFTLFWQTYEKATTRFEKLNRAFFGHVAAAPASRFIVLREKGTGRAAAFMLCFLLGGMVINKFIGIDYARPKDWLLYFRLWDAAVEFALANDATAIQSGQTGYAPKIETGHRLVPLTNYCMHRNRIVHAVARRLAADIGWATLDDALARHVAAHPEDLPAARPPPG